jgi:hypothetical protein
MTIREELLDELLAGRDPASVMPRTVCLAT